MELSMTKMTPNLIVKSIEASLPFWMDRLGFEKLVEVPHGDKLGFVILQRGNAELMLQSRDSLSNDVAEIARGPHGAVVYLEVDDLDALRAALAEYPLVTPERTTAYGAREIIVRDPDGHVVFVAHHAPPP
jgi:uncharacterized glyoxalase superfamily protein PhnB